ncbi:MAG TPA: hypothetical protein VLJ60_06380 [bacterium]|nr:hypothetical protein [bacterium]
MDFVFIGGGILGFLIDDPLASPVRTTIDIDIVLDIITDPGQIAVEKKLSLVGFRHDMSDSAPRCRWIFENIKVDILSIKDKFSGMNMKWLQETVSNSIEIKKDGAVFKVASPACFVAMKLEAFNDRGKADYLGSRDVEDVISVIDGRSSIVEEIKNSDQEIVEFISKTIKELLQKNEFVASISGHLMPDPASQKRRSIVFERLDEISRLH